MNSLLLFICSIDIDLDNRVQSMAGITEDESAYSQ